jgi:DNA-binding SARP family transcriptional activator
MSGKLQITTFGGLSIQLDGLPVTGFASRKFEGLLVYLACSGRAHPREALAELHWKERSLEHSMGNLRVAMVSSPQAQQVKQVIAPIISHVDSSLPQRQQSNANESPKDH